MKVREKVRLLFFQTAVLTDKNHHRETSMDDKLEVVTKQNIQNMTGINNFNISFPILPHYTPCHSAM